MANHKDAIKRAKQNENARVRNRAYRTRMRNQLKTFRAAVESGNVEAARAALSEATSVIQGMATKGVIHRNQASRRVARLAHAVKGMAA